MNAYRLEVVIIDHDGIGLSSAIGRLENAHYGNDCFDPRVVEGRAYDIGEWSDDHPLNKHGTDVLRWLREKGVRLSDDAGGTCDFDLDALQSRLDAETGRKGLPGWTWVPENLEWSFDSWVFVRRIQGMNARIHPERWERVEWHKMGEDEGYTCTGRYDYALDAMKAEGGK